MLVTKHAQIHAYIRAHTNRVTDGTKIEDKEGLKTTFPLSPWSLDGGSKFLRV